MVKLNLQLFAEDNAPAVGAGGVDTGGATGGAENQQQAMTPFQQMIQGEGKAEFDAAINKAKNEAVMERFKNQRDWQREINDMRPIVEWNARKYGVDPKDYKGIYAKQIDDLSQYQEEADKLGIPPEEVKQRHKNEVRIQQLQEALQQRNEEDETRKHFINMLQQADELKKTFPSFDLMQELANPQFKRMTSPQGGLSVKHAFYAIHGEEIQRQTMQYTAQQAGKRIAASVMAGASRPAENGQRRQGPVNVAVDIAHMDKKTREMYRKKINAGYEVNFVDKL